MSRAAALLIAIVAVACGGGSPARPSSPTAPAATAPAATATATTAPAEPAPAAEPVPLADQVERIVQGYQTIASAVGPGVRCPAVATSIAGVASATAGAREAVRTASRGEDASIVDGLLVAAQPRLRPALAAIDDATTRCGSEPAVVRALEELDR